eukprot:m.607629 g.607629  ORF g.607629 m.607629 type:complete len:68 (+) comp58119_c2_seq35:989-1192(+)
MEAHRLVEDVIKTELLDEDQTIKEKLAADDDDGLEDENEYEAWKGISSHRIVSQGNIFSHVMHKSKR